jgi:hypothetical protein
MDSHARVLFLAAAAFNLIAAAPFLFAAPQVARFLGMQPVPSDPLWVHLTAVLVLAFGWGYWRIARDPVGNRQVIHLGIVGKSLVVLVVCFDWLAGNTNWPMVLLVSADALFVALFVDYLKRHPIQQRGTLRVEDIE